VAGGAHGQSPGKTPGVAAPSGKTPAKPRHSPGRGGLHKKQIMGLSQNGSPESKATAPAPV